MSTYNIQGQLRKGVLELCILDIISRGEVYTSDMLAELTEARMMVVEGTLYPLLSRLKNAGYLEYKWVESNAGPPRKYYLLTDSGRQFLSGLENTWQEMGASVSSIMTKTRILGQNDNQEKTDEL